jgi:MoxR-like ATPase
VTDEQPHLRPAGDPEEARQALEAALFEVKRVIVGQDGMLERVFVALLAGGHILLEGVPGLAKTLTIKTVAEVIGGTFKRIQFTPDLVPADLVGTRINRAPAKVQSALLEVMQESQVTIGPQTYQVPQPFLTLATQNPIESEGTYPLPEAQVDRFMFKVVIDYPAETDELTVVDRSLRPEAEVDTVLSPEELARYQDAARHVYVDPEVARYAVALTLATREPERVGMQRLGPYIEFGASPRASINLVHGARALALLRGRNYALPLDVQALAYDVLRHRIVLTYDALAEDVTTDAILDQLVQVVPRPKSVVREAAA